MNSSERIIMAVEHKEPDKVPTHINATKWVVEKLKNSLGIRSDIDLLHAMHIDVYDMRGIDIHSGIAPVYKGRENDLFPPEWGGNINSFWDLQEFDNKTTSGWTIDMENPPLSTAPGITECEKYNWPSIDWFDFSKLSRRLENWSEFSIMATGGSVFQHPTFLRGMDSLLMDMMADPSMANYFYDKFTDFYYEYFKNIFEVAAEKIDVFALADDLGMQDALLISPEMFDEYVAPRLKRMIDLAHQYDIYFLLHSCGNIKELIPRFIDLGVDILDPIQPESMDPVEIKKEFGNHICLRGGISAQKILTHGTAEEVRVETRRIVDHLAPGGGYILSPGHPVLQDEIPVENILAMYETAYEYGFY